MPIMVQSGNQTFKTWALERHLKLNYNTREMFLLMYIINLGRIHVISKEKVTCFFWCGLCKSGNILTHSSLAFSLLANSINHVFLFINSLLIVAEVRDKGLVAKQRWVWNDVYVTWLKNLCTLKGSTVWKEKKMHSYSEASTNISLMLSFSVLSLHF